MAAASPGFERLLSSDLWRRIGHAVAEWGCPFPTLSDDELEQWLVQEAVMGAYHTERAGREREQEQRELARQEGRERLTAARQQGTV